MTRRACIILLSSLSALSPVARGGDGEPVEFSPAERSRILALSPLGPPPADPTNEFADNPKAAQFGQTLFFDARLSANGKISCSTCHNPQHGFADDKSQAVGMQTGTRRTESLWNVAYNRWFFWDGRADSLWSQAVQPMERAEEHGLSRRQIVKLIAETPELRSQYETVCGPLPNDSDTAETVDRILVNVAKCIAAYERRLVTRDSPFDRFVAQLRRDNTPDADGDTAKTPVYPAAAQRGLKLFIGSANCRLCHSGPRFTDNEFHNIRVPPLGGGPARDPGRFGAFERLKRDPLNAAGSFSADADGAAARRLSQLVVRPDSWGQFKTPGLRNVATHPPYMHQGQFATLADVVRFYSTLEGALPPDSHGEQLLKPLALSPREIDDLVAFLESLTGDDIDPALLRAPSAR